MRVYQELKSPFCSVFRVVATIFALSTFGNSHELFAQDQDQLQVQVQVPAMQIEEEVDDEGQDEELDDLEVEIVAGEVGWNQFGVEPAKMAAAKKFQLEQTFAVAIEEMTRVCELDKKQVLKLTIGAKGATKKLLAAWKKTAGQMFGIQKPITDDDRGDIEVEIKDADQIDETTAQFMQFDGSNPYRSKRPTDSDFWQKTVDSVLSETQSAAWKSYARERLDAKRNSQIALVMDTLTIELGLTGGQQTELSELVTDRIQDFDMKCNVLYEPYIIYYQVSKVSDAKLKKLLSASQHQNWKLFMAPMKQVGQLVEMQDNQLQVEVTGFADEFWTETFGVLEEVADVVEAVQEQILEFFKW